MKEIVWTKAERFESPARHCTLITPSGNRYTLFSLATMHEDREDVQFRIELNDQTIYEHQHDMDMYGELPGSERRAIRQGIKQLLGHAVEHASKTAILWCSHMAVPFTIIVYTREATTYDWRITWLERDTDIVKSYGSETTGEKCYGWRSAMASAIENCMCN